ncbi:hypothetical protein EZV73_26120 [Acidaminobacter sp. JC074]|uniref:EFR1 family ferrodoxin n=1 Tax=Acidaminobacter sp. JC074 TaxID=2530199 RepID=UPI001F0E026D|nr:EFR1 family ferrodoxin [Acidaminobacter sp. JC074]MCH4891082.1 hypothetical protein [Acidaminobacter sp. JC074]
MIHISYFSATGNTKYLAKHLGKLLNLEDDQIALFGNEIPSSCSHLILMFPINGFNPPRPVKKHFNQITKGINKLSLIAVGCNNAFVNDAVTLPLKKSFSGELCVDRVLAMPLTFITPFPDEVGKKSVEESLNKLKQIKEEILEEKYTKKKVSIKSKIIHTLGKLESPAARLFGLELHASDKCSSCGICWSTCPFGNIKNNKGKPKFGFKCGLCMKCIYTCPEKAISPYVSKFIPIKDGYDINRYLKK